MVGPVSSVPFWVTFASRLTFAGAVNGMPSTKTCTTSEKPVPVAVIFVANLVGALFCIGFFVMPIVALTYVTQLRASVFQRLEQLASED